jgi:soluble calcium-activated nucleotidase 1
MAWDAPAQVETAHNEAGRGCELSELVKFGDALYTFDDRTGIMFQIMNPARSDAAEAPFLVPRHIFSEGPGNVGDKGLKIEWATVKDGAVTIGSFGKEFTNNKGEVVHANNLWTVAFAKDGTAAHHNWRPYYDAMRATLGYTHPGYLLHEAVAWSPHHRKWFVFPRRVSKEKYDDVTDEKKGSNLVIMASHDFKDVTSTTVGVRARAARAAGALRQSRDLRARATFLSPLLLPPPAHPLPYRKSRHSAVSPASNSSPARATASSSHSSPWRTPRRARSRRSSRCTEKCRAAAAVNGRCSLRRRSCR